MDTILPARNVEGKANFIAYKAADAMSVNGADTRYILLKAQYLRIPLHRFQTGFMSSI